MAALLDTLHGDPDRQIRVHAALALGDIGAPAATAPLLAVLNDPGQPPPVRGAAAEALVGIRDAVAIPSLIAALEDGAPEVRYWAAFALGELGAEAAIPALEKLAAGDTAAAPDGGTVQDEARAAIDLIRASAADPRPTNDDEP